MTTWGSAAARRRMAGRMSMGSGSGDGGIRLGRGGPFTSRASRVEAVGGVTRRVDLQGAVKFGNGAIPLLSEEGLGVVRDEQGGRRRTTPCASTLAIRPHDPQHRKS